MSRARPTDKRLWLVVGAALLAPGLGLWALLWLWQQGLTPSQADALFDAVEQGTGLLLLGVFVVSMFCAWGAHQAYVWWVRPAVQLLEGVRTALQTPSFRVAAPAAASEMVALADGINQLQQLRLQQQQSENERVTQASQGVELERNRLAALMSELTQSVVVCNLDGTVLLYNNRARLQFKVMGDGGEQPGLGLGRSVFGVLDATLVNHALDSVRYRLGKGVQQPTAQFVTATRAGQLLKVRLAPVRLAGDAPPGTGVADLSGFVLMLDNITREQEQAKASADLIWSLTEGARPAMGNLQAAVEVLDLDDVPSELRSVLWGVVRDGVADVKQRLFGAPYAPILQHLSQWSFEDMLGSDFVDVLVLHFRKQLSVELVPSEVQPGLWLRLESFVLLHALSAEVRRLGGADLSGPVACRLVAWGHATSKVKLALSWKVSQADSAGVVVEAVGSAQPFAETVERHGGTVWFAPANEHGQATLRLLLPEALPPTVNLAEGPLWMESRPAFYDFDLFRDTPAAHRLEDRLLSELVYTVFDTETTGLNPSGGDEIIQIGAVRVVNGKVLHHEHFEQLVNPRRSIPAHTIPIHGITPGMLTDQPTIDRVLPRFFSYAEDTVLVAHNAAFDMRFLQLKEKDSGVVFDQPVLDTLLLSAIVHPLQDSHRLEAIAARFNVPVIGRHTADGDALVTAQVFLEMIPLLANKGIHTLGQAMEASKKTYFSKINYR